MKWNCGNLEEHSGGYRAKSQDGEDVAVAITRAAFGNSAGDYLQIRRSGDAVQN